MQSMMADPFQSIIAHNDSNNRPLIRKIWPIISIECSIWSCRRMPYKPGSHYKSELLTSFLSENAFFCFVCSRAFNSVVSWYSTIIDKCQYSGVHTTVLRFACASKLPICFRDPPTSMTVWLGRTIAKGRHINYDLRGSLKQIYDIWKRRRQARLVDYSGE